MASPGQLYIKRTNKRGDVFFDYGSTPDQETAEACFPSDDSDENNEPGDIGDAQGEGLSGQFAGFGFRDADAGTHGRRPRRHSEENDNTTRRSTNVQWEMDNLPIDGTRPRREHVSSTFRRSSNHGLETDDMPSEAIASPSEEEPIGGSTPYEGGLSNEHTALIALERAYSGLGLPIEDDIGGENKNYMVQVAVQFIFHTLPWLNHVRSDLETLGDFYDESDLAEKFYSKYRVAIWGLGDGAGRELHDQRLASLDTFFAALRTQETTRDDAKALGNMPLKQLVHLRRTAAAASRVIPNGSRRIGSPSELYAALEIQTADNWVNSTFPRVVAEMLLQALSRVRGPVVTSFPCSLPSGVLIEGVIDRIMARYERKLWPDDTAKPEDVTVILHRYILALMKSNMSSSDIGDNAVQMLDSFLGVEEADTEEESSDVHNEPHRHAGLRCPQADDSLSESCSGTFASAADVSSHLQQVHEWSEDVADDFVYDCWVTSTHQ